MSRKLNSLLIKSFVLIFLFSGLILSPLLSKISFAEAPDTIINSTFPSPSTSDIVTLGFISSDPSSTFECSLNDASFAPCTSPYSISTTTPGNYNLKVRSTNLSEETDSTPASFSWIKVNFDAGDGSDVSPFQISNCNQLVALNNHLSSSAVLVGDVDCSNTMYTFRPIGTGENPFVGNFDGQGHTIENINYSSGDNNVGLFGSVSSPDMESWSEIKDFYLKDSSFTGGAYVGALAGNAGFTTITDIRIINSTVSGNSDKIGGLVGQLGGASINTSSFEGTVHSSGSQIGGLVGYEVGPSNVFNSFSKVTISGANKVGGAIGEIGIGPGISIANSYAIVNFSSSSDSNGGLVSAISLSGSINNSFAVSNLPADSDVDGSEYKNNSSNGPLASWEFGHDKPWHVNYDDYPSLSPLNDPFMVCESSVQTLKSIHARCDYLEKGWGTTTWESAYQIIGSTDWTPITLSNNKIGDSTVNNVSPYNNYHIRFRYSNDWGTSPWGSSVLASVDSDNDGINDLIEHSGPNSGDSNSDGLADKDQSSTTSFYGISSERYTSLSTSCGTIINAGYQEESSNSPDVAYFYPNGIVNFTAHGCSVGATATITAKFYGDFDSSKVSLRKYNPSSKTYSTIPNVNFINVTIDGQKALQATYQVTDGGPLDEDSVANGEIVDPVGIATSVSAPNTGLPKSITPSYIFTIMILVLTIIYVHKRQNA